MKFKEQLLRWTLIVRAIQKRPGLSFFDLQREVMNELSFKGYDSVCSDATLKRDLKELRDEFDLDIVYNRTLGGYELKQIKKNWLDVDCLIEPLEMMTAFDQNEYLPEWIILEKYSATGTQHLSSIIRAIKLHRKITFQYVKYSDRSRTQRILSPYAIKQWQGRWYVVGKEDNGSVKTFGMDRIVDLELKDECFEKDSSFDAVDKFRYSYGIYSSTEYPIEEILISCDHEDGSYLKSRPLHWSQRVVSEDENEVVLGFKLRITPDFVMEIVSRSWSVKVIQPESLKERLCDIYKNALLRNGVHQLK